MPHTSHLYVIYFSICPNVFLSTRSQAPSIYVLPLQPETKLNLYRCENLKCGSGWCPVAILDISGVETSGSAIIVVPSLINKLVLAVEI